MNKVLAAFLTGASCAAIGFLLRGLLDARIAAGPPELTTISISKADFDDPHSWTLNLYGAGHHIVIVRPDGKKDDLPANASWGPENGTQLHHKTEVSL